MSGQTVTRADLSEAVYQEVGLSRNESAELVESVLGEISGALVRGEMVKISSFGSFSVRQKGERVGRNPKTGEEAPSPAVEPTPANAPVESVPSRGGLSPQQRETLEGLLGELQEMRALLRRSGG